MRVLTYVCEPSIMSTRTMVPTVHAQCIQVLLPLGTKKLWRVRLTHTMDFFMSFTSKDGGTNIYTKRACPPCGGGHILCKS